ncbi:MAG: NAD(P)H-dependent oxidoreductase [Acidiferrobacterales bacterium]|nr:NAD(P)H-dependent oxidoreductase [Acidiferrobacterales bacterium]
MPVKILAFAGSTGTRSLNKKLVGHAAQLARLQGAEVRLIDLKSYPLPLYDSDLERESGVPDNALAIRTLMVESEGILVSCPEYNSAISGVLKNTIDWVSRPVPDQAALAAFTGKTVALLAASPGRLGGIRTLASVRSILSSLGMIVVPKQYCLGLANAAFDDNDTLIDESAHRGVCAVVEQLIEVTESLGGL